MRVLRTATATLAALAVLGGGLTAGPKTTVQHDRSFDFPAVRTYGWPAAGTGEIKVLEPHGDDPVVLRAEIDPVITAAVEQRFARLGLAFEAAGPPDLVVKYHVLIGPAPATKAGGQVLPPVAEWGVPPLGFATDAAPYEQGSLILDLVSPATQRIVWRGVVQAEIDRTRKPDQRDKRIRDGIVDLLKKFPPKS
jgi:hypothetical protein